MTATCHWCDEPILPGERLAPVDGRNLEGERLQFHWECGLRMAAGGVNHQNGTCRCCGGTDDPDPPDISCREAAHLAAQAWLARNPPQDNP